MEDLIIRFGYPALFLGSLLEGESFLIAAGFLARRGYLNLSLVMLAAMGGTYVADVSFYFLSRARGMAVISKFPIARAYYPKVKRLFDRYGIWAIFITRYLYGFRLAAAATFGLMQMRKGKYLPFNLLSCAIWAAVMGSLGYVFGASLEALIGQVKHYEKFVVLFIIIIGLAGWLIRRSCSRRQRQNTDQVKEQVRV